MPPPKVLEKALGFFGPGGSASGESPYKRNGVKAAPPWSNEGGGGRVFVQACEEGKGAEVDLETREWDRDSVLKLNN